MKSNITPLQRFWMTIVYEYNVEIMGKDSAQEAFECAMYENAYEPIDTKFCMIYHDDGGWALFEASGTKIIRILEAGSMEKSR
jgi:hypothetical protein